MKTMFTLSKKAGWALFLSCFSVLFLTVSCTKDNPEPEPIPTGEVKIQFVNAYQGSNSQSFYTNATLLGTQAVAYGSASGYLTSNTSNTLFSFRDSGAAASSTANAGVQDQLEIGASYTFYYFRTSAGVKAADYLNDNTALPASGKAKVRFLHLNSFIAKTIPLSITVQGSATPLVSEIYADGATNYYEVDAASKFTVAGLSSSFTFNNITLVAGKIYTIWLGGATSTEVTGNVVLQN